MSSTPPQTSEPMSNLQRLTSVGLGVSLVLGVAGPFATYSIQGYRVEQNAKNITELKSELLVVNTKLDITGQGITTKLSSIQSALDTLSATIAERQRQEDRRYKQ
jgi:hypothetical protein